MSTGISLRCSPTSDDREEVQRSEPDRVTTILILVTVTGVTIISSLLAGIMIVGLPEMAKDLYLYLSDSLLLWYVAFKYLPAFFQSPFTWACGLAQDSLQLLVFRALSLGSPLHFVFLRL